MPSIKLVASLLAVSAIATCLDDLDDHLAKLRQNPSDIPEAQRIVALGGGEQAKLSMQAALRAAIEQPDGNYLVNRSSAISFALLIGVDRTNQAALGYLRKRAEEAADLTAPVAFMPEVAAPALPGTREPASFTPEFVEWARARGNRDPMQALYEINQYSNDLVILGLAGDNASTGLFERSLKSNQFGIVMGAVRALAHLGATDFAGDALAACDRVASSDAQRHLFGVPLMEFAARLPDFHKKLRAFVRSESVFRELELQHKNPARE